MEKRDPLCTVGGNMSWYGHDGKQYGGSSKTRSGIAPFDPAVPLLDIYLKKMKMLIQKGYLQPHVHCSIAYNSQDMATA